MKFGIVHIVVKQKSGYMPSLECATTLYCLNNDNFTWLQRNLNHNIVQNISNFVSTMKLKVSKIPLSTGSFGSSSQHK